MLKTFLAILIILGVAVFGMCFNIIFRGKDFPTYDVGDNPEMKKRGIKCMKEIDDELFADKKKGKEGACSGNYTDACAGCSFYPYEKH